MSLFEELQQQVQNTSPPEVIKKNTKRKRKQGRKHFRKNICVSVYSDSHGRHLSSLLQEHSGSKLMKTFFVKPGLVLPGAPIAEIVKSLKNDLVSFTENDHLVFIGGTNDIGFTKESCIINSF